MKRILTAAVLIPLVLLAVFLAPLWLFLLIAVVVALGAASEYMAIVDGYWLTSFRLLSYLYLAALFVMYFYARQSNPGSLLAGIVVLLLLAPFLLLSSAMQEPELKAALPGAAMSYLAIPYIGLPLLLLAALRELEHGWVFLIFTFLAVWVGDAAAMYVGKSLGRHKLAPRISPGKTVEGAIASVAFAVGIGCLFAHFVPEIAGWLGRMHLVSDGRESLLTPAGAGYGRPAMWMAAAMAAAINLAAQLGDLLESALKRGAGVKDSGTILPGHGGVLDRIDALLLAMPVAFLLFLVFGERFLQG